MLLNEPQLKWAATEKLLLLTISNTSWLISNEWFKIELQQLIIFGLKMLEIEMDQTVDFVIWQILQIGQRPRKINWFKCLTNTNNHE